MITYHLSSNKVYWAESAEEAAVFTEVLIKVNITALQSNHIDGMSCFPADALGSWPNIHLFLSSTLNEISVSSDFSQVQCECCSPAYWQLVMWDRLENAGHWTTLHCLLALCRPPPNSINSCALQEVLGGPPVMQPEILMTASCPQGEKRGGRMCGEGW